MKFTRFFTKDKSFLKDSQKIHGSNCRRTSRFEKCALEVLGILAEALEMLGILAGALEMLEILAGGF